MTVSYSCVSGNVGVWGGVRGDASLARIVAVRRAYVGADVSTVLQLAAPASVQTIGDYDRHGEAAKQRAPGLH
ncbi:MAG: hypothetical protein HPY69_01485 [Armatimonadetes bacterium]|nr:hypothetical protein [Armatimonadota bacterium]